MAVALAGADCESESRPAAAPARALASYDGHAAELFDDAIEPSVVGLNSELTATAPPDRELRERTLTADLVARARIVTVTSDNDATRPTWHVGLRRLETLGGPDTGAGDVTLEVTASSLAAGLVRAFEGRMVGLTAIVFARAFAPTGQGADLHFHLAPDDPKVINAIRASLVVLQMPR